MPPKAKISKESALNAALKLTQKNGWESISARGIANELGCSTQPIFRIYKNMPELKAELYSFIEEYYNRYIKTHITYENIFRSIGISNIIFARNEPNLFKALFMSDNIKTKNFVGMIDGDNNAVLLHMIAQSAKVSPEKAKTLYVEIWLFTHGIASMIATNSCKLENREILKLLTDACSGFAGQMKES